MKKYVSIVTGMAMTFAWMLFSYNAMAQAKCAGSSCQCGGSIIAGGCATGWCCRPNVAVCECAFFSNRCRCAPDGAGSVISTDVPVVHEQNANAFASYLNSPDFSSAQSKEIAAKLPTLITASQNKNADVYYTTADNLEALAKSLPPAEKSKANAWVAARGGTVFIE